MYRVEGGNQRLATALAEPLGARLQLNCEVVALSQRGQKVRVSLKTGRRVSQMTCDYAILTLPAAILRRIPVTPALPAQQHEAIARLKYGRATRTLLQFNRRFWRGPGRPRAFGSALPMGAVWDGNEEQRGRSGILSLLAGGGASDATQAMTAKVGPRGLVESLDWLGAQRERSRGVAADRLGTGSVCARRLRVLRSVIRSGAAGVAGAAVRAIVLRRRAHEPQVAGLHERRDRKRTARGVRNPRRSRIGDGAT